MEDGDGGNSDANPSINYLPNMKFKDMAIRFALMVMSFCVLNIIISEE